MAGSPSLICALAVLIALLAAWGGPVGGARSDRAPVKVALALTPSPLHPLSLKGREDFKMSSAGLGSLSPFYERGSADRRSAGMRVAFSTTGERSRQQPTPNPITLADLKVVSTYPDYIDFQITVSSSEADISNAAIYRRIGVDGPFEPAIVTAFQRAPQTTINSRLVVGNYLFPPFTPITYYWEVSDLRNNELRTLPITVLFEDATRNWQQIDDGFVVVHWYDHDEAFGRALSRIAGDAYDRLAAFFGVRVTYKPRVILLNSHADFAQFQSFGRELPNVGGMYMPGLGLTVQLLEPGYPAGWLESVVPHELSHLVSDHYYPLGAGLPLFLEEGLATYNEAINRETFMAQVRDAARLGWLIPFSQLPDAIRSADVDTAILAYRESASIFGFIVDQWGVGALPAFLAAFRAPDVSLDAAVTSSFGVTLEAFERAWLVWLGLNLPTLTPLPTATPYITRTPAPTVTLTASATPDFPTATPTAAAPPGLAETSTPAAVAGLKRAQHTAVPESPTPPATPARSPAAAPCLGGLIALGAPLLAGFVIQLAPSRRRPRG